MICTNQSVELFKYVPECLRMKNVFLFKNYCPLEVVLKYVLQHCRNVVKLTCNIQHKYNCRMCGDRDYNVVILCCGNVAGTSFSQRCENNLLTTLYNVVFTLCVCWDSTLIDRYSTETVLLHQKRVDMLSELDN